MTKFFDTKDDVQLPDVPKDELEIRKTVDRERLEAANRAMRDAGFNPDLTVNGKAQVDQGVVAIKYEHAVSRRWQLDHGARSNDYMLQMIPRKPIKVDVRAVLEAIIRVTSQHIPETVQVYINPPNPGLEIDFYTVRLADVLKRPGATAVLKRLVVDLIEIDAWPTTT